MKVTNQLLTSLLALTLLVHGGQAENWPNWRGPNFNGSTSSRHLPASFAPKDAAWTVPMPGHAGSTPIIWGDHVFATSPDEAKNLNLYCFARSDGRTLWTRTISVGDKEKGRNNFAAPSPVTDGKRVIALFGTGDMAAYDFAGNELWKRSLYKEFGRFAVMWQYGSSPLLFDGVLYLQVLQRDEMPSDYPLYDGRPQRESFLMAMDPATGKTLWKQNRVTDSTKESNESYATPFPYRGKNGTEILVVGGDHVSGHRVQDGTEIWRARLYEKRDDWYRIVTSPVAENGFIYACGPKGQPVVAFRDGGVGNVTTTHRAWEFKDVPTDWATPLFLNGKLFVMDGGKRNLCRLNPKTGEKIWSGSLGIQDTVWSSPTASEDRMFILSEAGTLIVCETGEQFKIVNQVNFEDGPARSSVAIAQDQVFVRTGTHLYCFGGK
jgi:outer membrane protein assembly factor BamB